MVSYTDESRVLTVALGVFKSQTPQTGPDWAGLMAATLVAALPMLMLFMLFGQAHRQLHRLQRDQVRGTMMTHRDRRLARIAGAVASASRSPHRGVWRRRPAVGRRRHRVLAVGLRPAARATRSAPTSSQQQNPGLSVNISQYGWDDYWSKLTAGFIAGTAPDVFTDHLSKFAQFVDLQVLRPLDDLAATADIQDSDYQQGLAELWKGQDGKRYGAPKDWDTIAIFYNAPGTRGRRRRPGRRCRT